MAAAYEMEVVSLEGTLRARVRFSEGFAGFDGHFPGRPVLPGFCHIQAAVDLVRRMLAGAMLVRVENAKFTRPILPGEEVLLEMVEAAPLVFDTTLSVAGESCSRFRLQLRWPSQDEAGAVR
jgi:3-hydroxymyristoyl/3-hydroxydecanoyl-(acyl carrier protein) dehydratase